MAPRRDVPIAGHPDAIVIDSIGKLHAHRHELHGFCADCAGRYRPELTPHNPPSSWTVDLAALIAERGPDSPVVGMAPLRCPYCGGRRTEIRILGPGPEDRP